MRLVVGIDIDVWVFVVALKFAMPSKTSCVNTQLKIPLTIPLTFARMLLTVVSADSSSRKMQDDTVTGSNLFSLSINPIINA